MTKTKTKTNVEAERAETYNAKRRELRTLKRRAETKVKVKTSGALLFLG